MEYMEHLEAIDGYLEQGKEALMRDIYDIGENNYDLESIPAYAGEKLDRFRKFEDAQKILKWFFTEGNEWLMELRVSDWDAISRKGSNNLRELSVQITQGMINQSLLTLTEPIKRGLIELGDEFIVELPDGSSFDTKLDSPGNRLKERGRIKFFYENWKIKAGDTVSLIENEQGKWSLKRRDLLEDF